MRGSHISNQETQIPASMGIVRDSQVALVVKNPPGNARDIRDVGSIPGSKRSPGDGNGNPLQYSCLGNAMDRGPGRLQPMESQKSQTRHSN